MLGAYLKHRISMACAISSQPSRSTSRVSIASSVMPWSGSLVEDRGGFMLVSEGVGNTPLAPDKFGVTLPRAKNKKAVLNRAFGRQHRPWGLRFNDNRHIQR